MRRITPPDHTNAITSITTIIDSKEQDRGILLKTLNSKIIDDCNLYHDQKSTLELLPMQVFTEERKKALLHCYNSPTVPLNNITQANFKLAPYCPYCNKNPSETMDHYLPKQKFPEYCFYAPNLVPACYSCNGKKGDRYINSINKRIFLNAYFDLIPEEQFLFVDLSIGDDDIPSGYFYIDRTNITITDDLWDILQEHIKNFHLMDEYQNDMNAFITDEIGNWIKENPNFSIDDLRMVLNWQISSKTNLWNNFWKTVVYRKILASDELLQFLIRR
jgi:hypothetical protein